MPSIHTQTMPPGLPAHDPDNIDSTANKLQPQVYLIASANV